MIKHLPGLDLTSYINEMSLEIHKRMIAAKKSGEYNDPPDCGDTEEIYHYIMV